MIRIVDRYVVRQYVSTLVFSIGALCLIFIIVDLFESLDDFLDNKATFGVIVDFYLSFLPNILKLLIPIGMLLASLFSVGRLSGNNEITAMRSGGQSLLRFMLPLLILGMLMSIGQLYFNGWVVPKANARKFVNERTFLQRSTGAQTLFNLYFRDTPTRNVSIEFFDGSTGTARGVNIEEYSSVTSPRIVWRIDAPSMRWDTVGGGWIIDSGLRRTFRNDSVIVDEIQGVKAPFSIRNDQIERLQRNVEEMNFDELRDYIGTLKKGGKNTRQQEIDYYGQWAFPWANFIVVMLAVPFASVRRRGGIAVQIAAAMAISFVYIAFTKVSQAMGVNLPVPVEVVAWSANALFFLVGIGILVRTKS